VVTVLLCGLKRKFNNGSTLVVVCMCWGCIVVRCADIPGRLLCSMVDGGLMMLSKEEIKAAKKATNFDGGATWGEVGNI